MGWINTKLDENGEGLVQFKPGFKGSIGNQVWKDSEDSYHHKDGKLANHENGIASVEVQALAYDALAAASDIYQDKGEVLKADQFRRRVANIKERVLKDFWVEGRNEGEGYFALGLDHDEQGKFRKLEIKTSNMGHLLNSGILEGESPEVVQKREALIKTLFSKEMLCPAGIRTLASDEARFYPGAYHNGTVWLWDTYYISLGLERHGYHKLSRELKERTLNVVNHFKIFPEFVRGEEHGLAINKRVIDVKREMDDFRRNRLEQPPQEIQGWSVFSIYDLKFKSQQKIQEPIDIRKRAFENKVLSFDDDEAA